jgi:hypothetical protein
VSALILACIAVLALYGLSFYAIYRAVGLKVCVRALRLFEVSIEVASQSGSRHGRLSAAPADDPCSLGRPDNQTQADGRAQRESTIAIKPWPKSGHRDDGGPSAA